MRYLFPYLPQQSSYNKRLRAARGLIRCCARPGLKYQAVGRRRLGRGLDPGRPPGQGRRSSGPTWPDGPNTGTAPATPAGFGAPAAPGLHAARPAGRLRAVRGQADERQVLLGILADEELAGRPGQLDPERHGGRTVDSVTVRVLQRILALTGAIWHNDATGQPVMRSLVAYNH
jgi:hypothetical protein